MAWYPQKMPEHLIWVHPHPRLSFQAPQTRDICPMKDGKKHGRWLQFYKSGKLRLQVDYEEDLEHGPQISFFENGQLESHCTYKNGYRNGIRVVFRPDGNFSLLEFYQAGYIFWIEEFGKKNQLIRTS